MTKTFVLCHPQSKPLLHRTGNECYRISCGTTNIADVDFSEANDFFPTYASLNSALFETSVILTIWEHADELISGDAVAFLHTDVVQNDHFDVWHELESLNPDSAGLVVNANKKDEYNTFLIDPNINVRTDPMWLHAFDAGIHVYDYIKKYDADIYEYALDSNPKIIYGHQFRCSRQTFDILGDQLCRVVRDMKFGDMGLWTPHVFERLIGLYLSKLSKPVFTCAFLHYASSSMFGPGDHNLYGPRGRRFLNINSRYRKL